MSDSNLDQSLHKLVQAAQSHPPNSWERREVLGQLIRELRNSGQLFRPKRGQFRGFYNDIYEDALQSLFTYVCERIDNYNPERASVLGWVNFLLSQRFFVEASREHVSTVQKHMDAQTIWKASVDDLDSKLLSSSESTSKPFLSDDLKSFIQEDPKGVFQSTYVEKHPEANFQWIVLRRLDGYTWHELAEETGISISTLSSFYQRCIRKFPPVIWEDLPSQRSSDLSALSPIKICRIKPQILRIPSFLLLLFERLCRRGFVLSLEDYEALKIVLRDGFGWSSQAALRELCASLWAKSLREQETLFALFDQLAPAEEDWQLHEEAQETDLPQDIGINEDCPITPEAPKEAPKVEASQGLPPIFLGDVKISERPFVFEPQFPLSYREVAQAWRRLRRPVRTGPPIELDIEGTIEQHCRMGVASSVVLRPRRRNVARLLLLVDRQGSMAPFHRFCDEVCAAIQQAGRFEETALYYFHNVPAEGADDEVLEQLEDELFPLLDPILPQINSLAEGDLYTDSDLFDLKPLAEVLEQQAKGASVVILSDAGAGRGQYRVSRLLDTLAFLKALKQYTSHFVWINPLAKRYWPNSTAGYLARHVPMFSLDRDGMYQAVNVLRGQQFIIERPL